MDGFLPIKPGGSTFAIAGATSASPSTLIFPGTGEAVYVFDNSRNTAAAWVGYGPTSTAAQNNAVIPLLSGSSAALPIAKGTVQSFTLNAGLFFSVIMEQGSGTVTGNAGYGI
jgi:hypothetical protein